MIIEKRCQNNYVFLTLLFVASFKVKQYRAPDTPNWGLRDSEK